MSWKKVEGLRKKKKKPKTDTLDALDDDMKFTPKILWKYSEPTLNLPWACSEPALALLWTYSESALNLLWTCFEPTLNLLWIYSEDMPKIWQNLKSINKWVSNMNLRDDSASKKTKNEGINQKWPSSAIRQFYGS